MSLDKKTLTIATVGKELKTAIEASLGKKAEDQWSW